LTVQAAGGYLRLYLRFYLRFYLRALQHRPEDEVKP